MSHIFVLEWNSWCIPSTLQRSSKYFSQISLWGRVGSSHNGGKVDKHLDKCLEEGWNSGVSAIILKNDYRITTKYLGHFFSKNKWPNRAVESSKVSQCSNMSKLNESRLCKSHLALESNFVGNLFNKTIKIFGYCKSLILLPPKSHIRETTLQPPSPHLTTKQSTLSPKQKPHTGPSFPLESQE